jgi:hypothetical protein
MQTYCTDAMNAKLQTVGPILSVDCFLLVLRVCQGEAVNVYSSFKN